MKHYLQFFSIILPFLTITVLTSTAQGRSNIAALDRREVKSGDTIFRFYAVLPPPKFNYETSKFYHCYTKDTLLLVRGGATDRLLNGVYEVFFPNKNIMTKGNYVYGLKNGQWKTWLPNGEIKTVETWVKGEYDGAYSEYDDKGREIKAGKYKKGLFTGYVIEQKEGQQNKTFYVNGAQKSTIIVKQ